MNKEIIPIIMPKWGLSMQEGTLAAWHVQTGNMISPGDEIMDVETDKIANIVEAPDGGLLRRQVGQIGQIYPVRALLGVLAPETVTEAEIDAFVEAFKMPDSVEEQQQAAPAWEFVNLSIGKIRYAKRDGDGVPAVLIHGFGGDLDNWLFNIDALAGANPVYALDLPGHGQSVKTIADPDLGFMVAALVEFLDHLQLDKPHLIGHSMGGLISGKLAIAHPERVASLVLICPAGLGEEINSDYLDGFITATGRKDLKPALLSLFANKEVVSRSMVNDLLKYKRLDGVYEFLSALRQNLFGGGRQLEQIASELDQTDCPIRVIWGEQDEIIPKAHATAISRASVSVIAEAGHMVQMEQAAQINALIQQQF